MRETVRVGLIGTLVICVFVCTLPMTLRAQTSGTASDQSGFALLVDVSVYKDASIPPLLSKGRGVYEIRDILHSAGGFPEEQIHVVAGEDATREGIIEALTTVTGQASAQPEVRFLFYLDGRSLMAQGKPYFLPYDARSGAVSTYIGKAELDRWWNGIQFGRSYIKAYMWAMWDMDQQGDAGLPSQLAEIFGDEGTDADGNRNITFKEITARMDSLSLPGDLLQSNSESRGITSLIRLPSTLEVTSEPTGARVLLDNQEEGVTPASIVGLRPGSYQLLARRELYHDPEGQTIQITEERGRRVFAETFQLTPIRLHGTVRNASNEPMANAEVRISGTPYRQTVGDNGTFSFEAGQALALLEPGKAYEVAVESPDGLYSGKMPFDLAGTEDIELGISVAQSNWIEVVEQRFIAGDRERALSMLDARLEDMGEGIGELADEALSDVQPAIALEFLNHLQDKLQTEPGNVEWRFLAATLAEVTGNTDAARLHWKAVKSKASRDTEEYRRAAARLKQIAPIRRSWMIAMMAAAVIAGLAVLGTAGVYVRRWIRFRTFREIPNPYIAGKPISESDMFFGREDVFDFIKEKFSRAAKDITIVLHGGRRTGKTSIMYQIANGRLGEDFVPVFIDLQEMAGVDAHDFFRIIAQKVSEVHGSMVNLPEADRERLDGLYRNLEDKSRSEYASFNEFLTSTASTLTDRYLIFLIDEYELLERKVNQGHLTDEIFTYLRHLMGNVNNLAFIFAGSRDFARRERKEWALMFNMAQPREVSFLSTENAISLITEPVKDYLRYDKKAVDRILRLTAGHPFFTQAMCLQIIEDLNDRQENKVTVQRVDQACHDIVENAPFHLAFVWRELLPEEKVVIALLAETITDGTAYVSVDDIASKLPDYELDYDRATINKSLARLFEDHLVETGPDDGGYRFRMDLIRAWIQAEHPTWGVLKEIQNNE